jgi:hypothetical protein
VATPALLPLNRTTVVWINSAWRQHDATSETSKPAPKGKGTVWQRAQLIGPDRTHPNLDDSQRGIASWISPASLGINRQ